VAEPTLEQRLGAIGAALAFPREEALAADVVAALRPAPAGRWRRPALVAAAVLLVVAAVLAAVPGTRHAVARLLGFEHLPIRAGVVLPPAGGVELGPPLTLDEVATRTGLAPYVVPELGQPLAAYAPAGGYAVVRYDDGGREVLVTTIPGTVDEMALSKMVGSGSQVRPVAVAGHDGWWITGRPHLFLYADPERAIREARPAADTLAWQVGGTIVRIEADVPLADARRLAEGARPAPVRDG
jgi:hypothetical protein